MLLDSIEEVLESYRLNKYRSLFSQIKERPGSLSATEAFCVDVIKLLDQPTIKQFSDFIGISQSNATYKINSLIQKGYITKEVSADDRREYRLVTLEKYHRYFDADDANLAHAVKQLEEKYSPEELARVADVLHELSRDLFDT